MLKLLIIMAFALNPVFADENNDIQTNLTFQGAEEMTQFYLIPLENVDAKKCYTVDDLKSRTQAFAGSRTGRNMFSMPGMVSLDKQAMAVSFGRVSNSSQDTKQVYCYRCAIGQEIGLANEKWCNERLGFWDKTKEFAKGKCK